MDGVVLGRDAHHLRTAPGDGTQVSVGEAAGLEHEFLGRLDLGDAVGNREIEILRRAEQALGMLVALEDPSAIGALALEHRRAVMQAVG